MKRREIYKWSGVVAGLLIVAGVAYVLAVRRGHSISKKCEMAEQTWLSSAQKNQVLYVDGCFVPHQLTIKVGESVVFTNKMNEPMWVESDKKNDQLILPGFTSGQSWNMGESYSHSFDEAGTYGYHNRVAAEDQGEIIVQ